MKYEQNNEFVNLTLREAMKKFYLYEVNINVFLDSSRSKLRPEEYKSDYYKDKLVTKSKSIYGQNKLEEVTFYIDA